MKHILKNITCAAAFAATMMMAPSCTDFLDKNPDTDVSETIAFQNFQNFQGFIEEMYNCIPEKESCMWCTTFNWGEDEIMNAGMGNSHLSAHMDLGDYRHINTDNQNFVNGVTSADDPNATANPSSTNKFDHRIYPHSGYCIRKCNMGLKAIEDGWTSGCSEEEINVLKGQLLFFRAWWHNQVMDFYGGMPYITEVLDGSKAMPMTRLSYREAALLAAKDYEAAAELLPADWDKSGPGRATKGKNELRITKATALAYAGKCLLWAASPLMENNDLGVMEAGSKTYEYNQEIANKAAEVLAKALILVESGKTPYSLAEYKYADIYNHTRDKSSVTNYTDIFYTTGQSWKQAGTCEAMLRGSQRDINGSPWNFAKLWGSKLDNFVGHDQIIHLPTANYVNYAYGMENGEPAYIFEGDELVPNTAAGFDPAHPFLNRDPRFYHDIVFDGMHLVEENWEGDLRVRQNYASLYTGGFQRDATLGSRTGYFCQKLVSKSCNEKDKMYEWAGAFEAYLPYMRLADVYLLYAEAVVAAKKGDGAVGGYVKASEAINVLRNRVGAGEISSKYTGSYEALMDEVRRERACELAFEGHRWNDLQRWMLLTSKRFNKKFSQEFDRTLADRQIVEKIGTDNITLTVWNEWYEANDPREAEVANFRMKEITTRLLGTKHYWFPLPDRDVYLYEDFKQNPGW